MSSLTFQLVVVGMVMVLVNGASVHYYATKYDHLDVEQILNNRRMVNYYAQCLLSKGPCPPQGLEFKRILPDALETNCLRCTEKQKAVTYRTIKRLKKEYPKIWAELQNQWDPNDIYVRKFEETYRDTPPSQPSENEIIFEDRFGEAGAASKITSNTTPTVTPTYSLPTSTSSRQPNINSIGAASNSVSQGLLPVNPIPNNVEKNQVGKLKNNRENSKISQLTTTTQKVETELNESKLRNSVVIVSTEPASTTVLNAISPAIINISPETISNTQTQSQSYTTNMPLVSNLNSLSLAPLTNASENIPTTSHSSVSEATTVPHDNGSQTIITFEIPPSSLVRNKTVSPTLPAPSNTANFRSSTSPTNARRPIINIVTPSPSSVRQPDVLSQVLSSLFNNNRPPPLRVQASIGKNSKTPGNRPVVQIRLPGFPNNNQGGSFNPVGNFVRGITNVGGRLLETGTSIADSVLSSVRTLLTAPRRFNRNSRL